MISRFFNGMVYGHYLSDFLEKSRKIAICENPKFSFKSIKILIINSISWSKNNKTNRYIFQAIAIETSCVFGQDTNAFISRLGHLTTSISGERREAEFLRQRLSLATVRGNAQSVTQAGRPSS